MLITGQNGVQQVLISMAIWFACCDEDADSESKRIVKKLVDDVRWVLDANSFKKVREKRNGKRVQRDDDGEPEKNKAKRARKRL